MGHDRYGPNPGHGRAGAGPGCRVWLPGDGDSRDGDKHGDGCSGWGDRHTEGTPKARRRHVEGTSKAAEAVFETHPTPPGPQPRRRRRTPCAPGSGVRSRARPVLSSTDSDRSRWEAGRGSASMTTPRGSGGAPCPSNVLRYLRLQVAITAVQTAIVAGMAAVGNVRARIASRRTVGSMMRTSQGPADSGGHMAQVRRMTVEQVPDDERAQAQGPVPGYVAPAYVLVAALSILEGYCWLQVISAGSWRPSAMASALAVCAVTAGVWHLPKGRQQMVGAVPVALSSVALVGLTGVAIVTGRPVAALLAGACNLLVGLLALAAVVATELWGGKARTIPVLSQVGAAAASGFSGRDRPRQTNETPRCPRPRRGPAASIRTPPAGPAPGPPLRVARSRRSPIRRPGPCRPPGQ